MTAQHSLYVFHYFLPPVLISCNLFNLFVQTDSLAGAWQGGSANSLVLHSQLMYFEVCIVEAIPGDTAKENNWCLNQMDL